LVRAIQHELGAFTIKPPAGGWFVWARLPAIMSASSLAAEAERHGISFVPGTNFYVDGRGEDHIRLAFSMLGSEKLAEAVARLAVASRRLIEPEPGRG
jgi:DNA-binding transcriptional MocR family regulator